SAQRLPPAEASSYLRMCWHARASALPVAAQRRRALLL
ncbi:30S ribosomal protein S11, partial [Burkholderia pyrrocinia]